MSYFFFKLLDKTSEVRQKLQIINLLRLNHLNCIMETISLHFILEPKDVTLCGHPLCHANSHGTPDFMGNADQLIGGIP